MPSDLLADCDIEGQLVWIIPVSIVGGILVLGVLLLVIAKIILVCNHSSTQDTDMRYAISHTTLSFTPGGFLLVSSSYCSYKSENGRFSVILFSPLSELVMSP